MYLLLQGHLNRREGYTSLLKFNFDLVLVPTSSSEELQENPGAPLNLRETGIAFTRPQLRLRGAPRPDGRAIHDSSAKGQKTYAAIEVLASCFSRAPPHL